MKIINQELITISDKGLQIIGAMLGNEDSDNILICCHGFGVTSDSWGMYKKICEEFKADFLTIRFNFVSIDLFTKTTFVHEYSKQVEKLKTIVDRLKNKYPNKNITIIGHSQGTFIPPLFLKIYGYNIDKLILLSPPATSDITLKMKTYFEKRSGTKFDLDGDTILQRSDNSKTIVPEEFWKEAGLIDPISLFRFADSNYDTYFIWAKEDKVLSNIEYKALKEIGLKNIFDLPGGHDFKEDNWEGLVKILREII